jgi:hypothetical protein
MGSIPEAFTFAFTFASSVHLCHNYSRRRLGASPHVIVFSIINLLSVSFLSQRTFFSARLLLGERRPFKSRRIRDAFLANVFPQPHTNQKQKGKRRRDCVR